MHCHTVHLPRGALLSPCTVCGRRSSPSSDCFLSVTVCCCLLLSVTGPQVESIFGLLDLDGDGGISRAEMRAAFRRYEYSALRLALCIKPR